MISHLAHVATLEFKFSWFNIKFQVLKHILRQPNHRMKNNLQFRTIYVDEMNKSWFLSESDHVRD